MPVPNLRCILMIHLKLPFNFHSLYDLYSELAGDKNLKFCEDTTSLYLESNLQ